MGIMADLLANLPPVPPSLKSIAPYLQRAEELRTQDPVISYWCVYYAAQIGLNLKIRDAASHNLLLALLDALEQKKNQIGSNDAVHVESASAAYVENFALKVFANADNEDRSSHATKFTAKKFLAAANFLEVLKTFPKSDISESNEEKIRYAKWKAADIAKAFREGRKPPPGPPGWAEEQEALKRIQQEVQKQEQQEISSAPTLSPGDSDFPLASHPTVTAATLSFYETSQDELFSPSSNVNFSHPPLSSIQPPNDPAYPGWTETGDHLSQTWSTAATPDVLEQPNLFLGKNLVLDSANVGWEEIPFTNFSDNATEPDGSEPKTHIGSSSGAIDLSGDEGPSKKTAWISHGVEGQYSPISSIDAGPDNKLQFSPSTIGSQPPQPPPQRSPVFRSSPPSSSEPHIYAQQSPPAVYSRFRAPPPPPVPVQEDPIIELTPGIIAKAQKHCRFAVSALNYEDAEQAKKELRAALALLGG